LVVSLNDGIEEFREDDNPTEECDYATTGSGRWHLCLREMARCAAKDMELRRVLKSPQHPSQVVKSPCSAKHLQAISSVLGNPLLRRLQDSIQNDIRAKTGRGRQAESREESNQMTVPRRPTLRSSSRQGISTHAPKHRQLSLCTEKLSVQRPSSAYSVLVAARADLRQERASQVSTAEKRAA